MEEDKFIQVLQKYSGQQLTKMPVGRIPTVEEIEQQNLSLNGNSSSNVEADACEDLENLKISKKKRTRRKPRHRNKADKMNNVEDDVVDCKAVNSKFEIDDVDDSTLWNFKITAVSNQTSAKVFRIKNGICCKHININLLKYVGEHGSGVRRTSLSSSFHKPKVDVINDSFVQDASKSPVEIKNGTTHELSSVPQFHNSNLQLPSTFYQNASASTSPKQRKARKFKKFQNYWSMQDVSIGLESRELMKGVLRINAKNFREAYVSHVNRLEQDYLIQSIADRNRALEGDVVVIKLKPQSEWTEKQKTAFVVHILEKVHSRTAVGSLHLMPDRNKQYAAFIPRDLRVPKMKIPAAICPPSFHQHPNRYENMLFKAKITMWKDIKHPVGTLIENIGVIGDLESETAALLSENNLDVTPFPPAFLKYVSVGEEIPDEEFDYREDLRKECIFTIDPLTARDLDDAVSCIELENGNLEIGVHISDVSYYLKEGTPLDKMVCSKATTIYLVNNVYHMLPRELCLHCSLLPGTDKLAFSVFWEMTKTGKIINRRFARTIINSCTQLAYEHAQMMIEDPNRTFEDGELPQIHGGFTYKDLSKIINYLQAIAVNLRAQRFENGALRIDQTKLIFRLDEDTGEPLQYFVYENKDAHRLIEEFMLLANISVAQKTVKHFPDIAFLRCHDPPNQRLLNALEKSLRCLNIDIDVSSSKAIQSSLLNVQHKQEMGVSAFAVLNHLLAKPMTRAKYFCSGETENEESYEHYALHVPIYTHFTSPIRRYADIMVHRLLAACLGYAEKPHWNASKVTEVANNCNKQKFQAKCAGDASSDLYLAHYIADHQPFVQRAVVIDVKSSSFDILVVATGSIIRMFPNGLGDNIQWSQEQKDSRKQFMIVFPETSEYPEEIYIIQLFSIVNVSLNRKAKTNKLEAKLLRPISQQMEQESSKLQ
ncbi:hypothetical protein ILUMI_02510 [Ignelater luminosus]|uniref:RNB domain-containing protein n=1 Tax=Ignelater luminosus TaxID=2038154 RepID=A0A8K0DDA9_IGNLU|nr:hypothetical protein ILUMI_02510 [Ignelater luminosus]